MFGRLVKFALITALLLAAAAGGTYVRMMQWAQAKYLVPGEALVEYKGGTGLSQLARQLAQAGAISSAGFFSVWVRLEGNYQHYQAGSYRFAGEVSPSEVAQALLKGDVFSPVVLQIAVPEGFRLRDVIQRLAANGVGTVKDLERLSHDAAFLHELHVDSSSLEGYLYPATYAFHKIPTPREALETMVKSFWQKLPKDYEKRVKTLGLTLNQAVIFASLIELETRSDEEKPLISEVIWRRLKDRVALGIDAALIYGIADYHGDLTWANLADGTNPYNTRIHLGLPPTPIGAPGATSLEAVMTPSNFGYYYYVLIAGEARHHFSKTLAEHNLNVKKLVNASKREKAAKDKP